jgi:hypothetical protein
MDTPMNGLMSVLANRGSILEDIALSEQILATVD